MKIKLVQDSIIFISGLKKEELFEAQHFCPSACTLNVKDAETKKTTPVCAIAYASDGSVSDNGIVYDSTTADGYMCKTLIASQGNDEHLSAEEKIKVVSETFAGLILKMNELEEQIKTALKDNASKIAAAKKSIEAVEI
jgi:predicted solute-binding protein